MKKIGVLFPTTSQIPVIYNISKKIKINYMISKLNIPSSV
jgi:hypothetical protein